MNDTDEGGGYISNDINEGGGVDSYLLHERVSPARGRGSTGRVIESGVAH